MQQKLRDAQKEGFEFSPKGGVEAAWDGFSPVIQQNSNYMSNSTLPAQIEPKIPN
jgi:hypothetical protein